MNEKFLLRWRLVFFCCFFCITGNKIMSTAFFYMGNVALHVCLKGFWHTIVKKSTTFLVTIRYYKKKIGKLCETLYITTLLSV